MEKMFFHESAHHDLDFTCRAALSAHGCRQRAPLPVAEPVLFGFGNFSLLPLGDKKKKMKLSRLAEA